MQAESPSTLRVAPQNNRGFNPGNPGIPGTDRSADLDTEDIGVSGFAGLVEPQTDLDQVIAFSLF